MIKLVLGELDDGEPMVTAYLDETGLDALVARLTVLKDSGGHVHLTDLLDSFTDSNRMSHHLRG